MEDSDPLDVRSCGAVRERRGAVDRWILFIEEEVPDEVVKVCLTNVRSKCPKGGTGVPRG